MISGNGVTEGAEGGVAGGNGRAGGAGGNGSVGGDDGISGSRTGTS
jgi:hypothetical protein